MYNLISYALLGLLLMVSIALKNEVAVVFLTLVIIFSIGAKLFRWLCGSLI